ncbi:hypothetical protein [Pedobacter nutrimenti]|uniref:Uncharacterized protein n=1 Tax=Pedobacter nutrimenti TaxID=1241337 RepID=A0A318UFR1_9SPHI|nr:hypothetical protein [Pedobacter nutrimenti]PYF74197.1 hypothetical protein B0O44_104368 [Pedobacter nutrimenti]
MLKKIIIGLFIILSGVGLYKVAGLFSPGTFPNAETYGIDSNENELIKVIRQFKETNPKYVPPEKFNLLDGRYKANDYWYRVYFYYPETKEIVYTWIRPVNSEATTLGFVRINKGDQLGHWKDINRDFDSSESKDQKRKFTSLILNPIKEMIKHEN